MSSKDLVALCACSLVCVVHDELNCVGTVVSHDTSPSTNSCLPLTKRDTMILLIQLRPWMIVHIIWPSTVEPAAPILLVDILWPHY